jgi:hypothetical protein
MLTNKQNLPSTIIRALTNDKYSKGKRADFSVTQIIAPAYQAKLKRENEWHEDAADRIFALLGQATHSILERAAEGLEGVISEKRFYKRIAGKVLSGQIDLLENGVLSDFKVTSTYKREASPDWTAQLNMLKLLAQRKGRDIHTLQIIAIYRDWSATQAERSAEYPQAQVGIIPVPMWTKAETLAYVKARLAEHMSTTPTPCTDEERWARPGVFAVMKEGQKSAVKLCDSAKEAEALVVEVGGYVEERPKVYTRCDKYCPVAHVCPLMVRP